MPEPPPVDEIRAQKVRRSCNWNGVWEGSVYELPMLTGQKKGPSYFPCLGVWADHHSGVVLGQDLRLPEEVGSALVDSLFSAMESSGQIPQVIRVNRECYRELLGRMSDLLQIQVERVDRLPALQEAMNSMERQFLGKSGIMPAVERGSKEQGREDMGP